MRRSSEWVWLLLVLAAFLAIGTWLVLASRRELGPVHIPLSTFSPEPDGCKALYELLPEAGVSTDRHALQSYDYPPQGCVVAVSQFDDSLSMLLGLQLDLTHISNWVNEGGAFVLFADGQHPFASELFAAIEGIEADSFDPTQPYHHTAWSDTLPAELTCTYLHQGQTGGSFSLNRARMSGSVFELPAERPALFSDVELIEVADDSYAPSTIAETLLGTDQGPDPLLFYLKHGQGEVYWFTRPELVTNDWLKRQDNHQLALAIISQAAQGRTVFFDEKIHGYSESSHSVFTLITQTYGGRLLLVLCLLFILVYLGQAIRPARYSAQAVPPRRQAAEMVLAQADLYLRAGVRQNSTRSLVEGLKRQLVKQHQLTRIVSNRELLTWLQQQHAAIDPVLASYLGEERYPTNDVDFLRLSRTVASLATELPVSTRT